MKRRFLSAIAAVCLIVALWPAAARADDNDDITLSPTFGQTEARSMLDLINAFRTGNEAYYWNESNTATVESRGAPLVYSYALEEIAMQRAAEIALSFSHTRPDATRCFTALASDGTRSWGENIAAGNLSASAAFTLWREDDENYNGQGHRRNMLSTRFQTVGVGHAVLGGRDFWVQEFSYYTDDMPQTAALDTERTMTVSVAHTQIQSLGTLTATPESIELAAGGRAALPTVSVSLKLSDAYPNRETVVGVAPVWTSGNDGVCTIAGQEVSGVAAGSTTLTGTALDRSVSVSVNVAGTGGGGGGQPTPAYTVSGAPSGNQYRVTLTNPAPVTVAVAHFDADGRFLSVNLQQVQANAGSVSFPLTSASTTRVMLLSADCRPLCVSG
ncbi:MAG: CAP domain-containing protein [Oscillibacter sp.]|nr:CAP domain-containing protein [Oscillibacter sp.]